MQGEPVAPFGAARALAKHRSTKNHDTMHAGHTQDSCRFINGPYQPGTSSALKHRLAIDNAVKTIEDPFAGEGFDPKIPVDTLQITGGFAMSTWHATFGLESRTADTFSSFRSYVDAQEELFVESMQDAAANQWDLIGERRSGATEREIGTEMNTWWNDEIRRFWSRLWKERQRERIKQLKRAMRRENTRRIHAEEQMQAADVQLYHAQANLSIERELTIHLREQRRCRECNGELPN